MPIIGNITTGPQDGSPLEPRELMLSKSVAYINLKWTNGPSGRGPIKGYYIESQKRDDTKWTAVAKSKNGQTQEFTVSFQTLLPSTVYKFRISSYNKFGISCPAYFEETVLTPSKLYLEYGYLQHKPFYHRPWFG
jgi:protein sidekick